MSTKTKYFFIAFTGLKLVDPSKLGLSEDSLSDVMGLQKVNGKDMLPIPVTENAAMLSDTGHFIPSMIEQFLKQHYKLTNVKITFVRDITKEEYEEEKRIAEMLSKDPNDRPLDFSTLNEIDKLISTAEKGDLRVIVDPKSEKPKGLYDELYDLPDDWKDD